MPGPADGECARRPPGLQHQGHGAQKRALEDKACLPHIFSWVSWKPAMGPHHVHAQKTHSMMPVQEAIPTCPTTSGPIICLMDDGGKGRAEEEAPHLSLPQDLSQYIQPVMPLQPLGQGMGSLSPSWPATRRPHLSPNLPNQRRQKSGQEEARKSPVGDFSEKHE